MPGERCRNGQMFKDCIPPWSALDQELPALCVNYKKSFFKKNIRTGYSDKTILSSEMSKNWPESRFESEISIGQFLREKVSVWSRHGKKIFEKKSGKEFELTDFFWQSGCYFGRLILNEGLGPNFFRSGWSWRTKTSWTEASSWPRSRSLTTLGTKDRKITDFDRLGTF